MTEKNNSRVNRDFETLTKTGNIGFYESCEITEIFVHDKENKNNFNLFTLCVFEEIPYTDNNEEYITEKLIKIDTNYKFGIKRYSLSVEKIKEKFDDLMDKNEWLSINSNDNLACSSLRFIPQQFIPANYRRLNKILKNNFHSGSYVLEFFDEHKDNFDFFIGKEETKNDAFGKIKNHIPIDLSIVSDRVGNFIFQFPVTLVEVESSALQTWDGIDFKFFWNSKTKNKPKCMLQIESILDDNYMNYMIEEYNGDSNQKVIIDNFQKGSNQVIKLLRKSPNLILTVSDNGYIEEIPMSMSLSVGHQEQRTFKNNNENVEIHLKSVGTYHVISNKENSNSKEEFYEHIIHKKDDIEREELEKKLDFKEYIANIGIEDLQKLVKENDENGVYLWDPFLAPEDIINTLFYSEHSNVELKALANPNIEKIQEYKDFFDNLESNNKDLNLEFRARSGNGHHFHDRFLIFPGNIERLEKPKVYSLGTSVNSYRNGKLSYYILQKVLYPQLIVDAFNNLWNQLDKEDCLVWKHPE